MMSRTNILLINNHSSSPPPTVIVSDPLNFIPVLNSDVKLKSWVIYVYMYHLQQWLWLYWNYQTYWENPQSGNLFFSGLEPMSISGVRFVRLEFNNLNTKTTMTLDNIICIVVFNEDMKIVLRKWILKDICTTDLGESSNQINLEIEIILWGLA